MAFSILQMLSNVSTNGTDVTTAAVDTTGATLIVIQNSTYTSSVAPTDSMGNTYLPYTDYTAASYHSRLWYCLNPLTSTTHTFSSPTTTATYPGIGVIVASGNFSSPLDQSNGSNPASATSVSPGQITPTQPSELIVCGLLNDNDGGNTITGVTSLDAYSFTTGNNNGIACGIGYKIQTAAAAINPTWSVSAAKYLSSTIASFFATDVAVNIPDTGTGADSIGNIAASVGVTDAGAGVETLPGTTNVFSLSDAGAGTDALSVAALLSIADAGVGVDVVNSINVAISIIDSGVGTDAVSLVGAGSLIQVFDSGIGSDAISNIVVSTSVSDSGHGTDILTINVSLLLAETATGTDVVSLLQAYLIHVADSGIGTDGLSIAVSVKIPDFGLGSDVLNARALVAVLESGLGSDVIVAYSTASPLVSMVFSFAKRRMQFSFSQRTMGFAFSKRYMSFQFIT